MRQTRNKRKPLEATQRTDPAGPSPPHGYDAGQLPAAPKSKRNKTVDSRKLNLSRSTPFSELNNKPSLNNFPTEILSEILKLAEFGFKSPVQQQRQRFTHGAVCKLWKAIGFQAPVNEYALKGFKQARRLARVFQADLDRAHAIRRLAIDLVDEERVGTRQMVADVMQRCEGLRELEITFLGRERYVPDAFCLSVPLYDAFAKQTAMEEFRLFFERKWTSLTLGGDLSRTLVKLPNLKRLDLPRILVPKINPTFKFSPSLTHLSVHLDGSEGSSLLLQHLISCSLDSLLHLHLTIHDYTPETPCDLSTLPKLLAPIANQLFSFSLTTPFQTMPIIPLPTPAPLASLLSSMTRVTNLTLGNRVVPEFAVLEGIPRLRHLTYHTDMEENVMELEDYLEKAGPKPALTELTVVGWTSESALRAEASVKVGQLKVLGEQRGFTPMWEQEEIVSEEDEYEEVQPSHTMHYSGPTLPTPLKFAAERPAAASGSSTAVFANGCFWGTEHMFRKAFVGSGLIDAKVGYIGGVAENPTYKQVCTGATEHAEAVLLTFDPSKVSYAELVEFHYRMHDPTSVNRQGPDVGTQYRSAIFTNSDEQAEIAKQVTKEVNEKYLVGKTIATQIQPAGQWWNAEDYHQEYLHNNPSGYECPSHRLYW
ncbi:peptide-methionine (S)-S-oxide reductase [Pseudohyphozyma bogoriensis]|nr:peptide-methionine (S)-S-oxide reductase [Pseudohyphozyma bogoriensis]